MCSWRSPSGGQSKELLDGVVAVVDNPGQGKEYHKNEANEEHSDTEDIRENRLDVENQMREFRGEIEAEEELESRMREFREELERVDVDARVRKFREELEQEENVGNSGAAEVDDVGDNTGESPSERASQIKDTSEQLQEQYRSEMKEKLESDEGEGRIHAEPEETPEQSDTDQSERNEDHVEENAGSQQVTVTMEVESTADPEEATEKRLQTEDSEIGTEEKTSEEVSEEISSEVSEESEGDKRSKERDTSEEAPEKAEEDDIRTVEEDMGSKEKQTPNPQGMEVPEGMEPEKNSRDDATQAESPEPDVGTDVAECENATEEREEAPTENTSEREDAVDEDEANRDRRNTHNEHTTRFGGRSTMFPDGDPVWPSMFPETREERLRRVLKEEFDKLSEEEKEQIRNAIKDSMKTEDLEKHLKMHRESIDDDDQDEKIRDAETFIRVREALENLEDPEGLDELSEELGIDRENLEKLADDANAPELVKDIWNLEVERRWAEILLGQLNNLSGNSGAGVRENPLESVENLSWDKRCIIVTERQYEESLARHQHLRFRLDFDDRDNDVRVFFKLKLSLEQGKVNQKGFAEEHNIAVRKIRRWAREEEVPSFLSELHRLELKRLYVGANGGPPEVCIESTGDVRKLAARHGREKKVDYELCEKYFSVLAEPETLQKDLALKYEVSDTTISQWLRDTEPRDISDLRRQEEERILEEWYRQRKLRLPLEGRLENTERYIRRISEREVLEFELNPDRMSLLHMYHDQFFYFNDINSFASLLADVKEALTGNRGGELRSTAERLERLMDDVFGPHKVPRVNITKMRIRGDHLEFLLSVSNRSIRDLEGEISKITTENGMGGIPNPKFPSREDLLVIWARVIATIVCDGSLKKTAAVAYHEPEIARIEIFERTVQRLGEVFLDPQWRKDHNCYIAHLPAVIGRVLQELGLPTGDKTIHNPEIDLSLFRESWEALCAIIEDSIPQDGTVLPRAISWTFSNALNAGNKREAYDFEPILDNEEVALIKEFGKPRRKCWSLEWGDIDRLAKSADRVTSRLALSIAEKIMQNPNRLVKNMQDIAATLGVKVAISPGTLRLMRKSDRVSISWYARTRTIDDMIRLALIAPPNDVRKRRLLSGYLEERHEQVSQIRAELIRRGVKIQKGGIYS